MVFLRSTDDGWSFDGQTTALEEGEVWTVEYAIVVDESWRTRRAGIVGRSAPGRRELTLESDGAGRWQLDGEPASRLDGCLDVDLESSSFTNAFPVHGLGLPIGQAAEAPAAYVRALDLSVERLEQRYLRIENDGQRQRYDYVSPRFDFRCVLVYDESGLVLDYPGIACRVV